MKPHVKFALLVVLLLDWIVISPLAGQDTADLETGLAMSMAPIFIFSEADPKSDKLAQVELGELVEVLQIEGDWAQIEYSGVVGWTQHALPVIDVYILVNVSGPTPIARGYHQMVYDAESDRMVLFGGETSLMNRWLNDTWAYDVGTNMWTNMSPAQSPTVGTGPLAYDTQSDRTIWVLGTNSSISNQASETWAYDYNNNTWTNMMPASAPPPLIGARMVYDLESDRMVLFGGANLDMRGNRDETWAYDYDSNKWTKMEPAVSPPGMAYHPMAYDVDADRVILVGAPALETTDDTWLYDYNSDSWEARVTAESPEPRVFGSMVYVAGVHRAILFGEGELTPRNDTWAYNFDTNVWSALNPSEAPSERGWHAMAYSSAADRIVLFGGGVDRSHFTMETWIYDPNLNTWTQLGP